MIPLGQPKEFKDQLFNLFKDRVRPSDGPNIHRILFGPVQIQTVFYPTREVDRETGELKSTKHAIVVPRSGSIFDELAAMDKRIKFALGEKNPDSTFTPNQSFLYLVFNRAEAESIVRVGEYKYSVVKQFIEKEEAVSTKDKTKLMYGPIFSWDAIIDKKVDPSKPKKFGVKYEVSVNPEACPLMGQIPIEWLSLSIKEFFAHVERDVVFTDEEVEAIQSCEIDLHSVAKARSSEEILELLQKFPIDLNANTPEGKLVFPAPKEFLLRLEELSINYLLPSTIEPSTIEPSTKTLPAPVTPGKVFDDKGVINENNTTRTPIITPVVETKISPIKEPVITKKVSVIKTEEKAPEIKVNVPKKPNVPTW